MTQPMNDSEILADLYRRMDQMDNRMQALENKSPGIFRRVVGFFWARAITTAVVALLAVGAGFLGFIKLPDMTYVTHQVLEYSASDNLITTEEYGVVKEYVVTRTGLVDSKTYDEAESEFAQSVYNCILHGKFGPNNPWPVKKSWSVLK